LINHHPRKRFGQHFLVNPQIIQKIIAAIHPLPHEHIVEIGPGKGALTFPLLETHPTLMAIEIDKDLVKYLSAQHPSLSIVQTDVLSFDFSTLPQPLRIIGNLPYNISTPLMFYLIKYKAMLQDMIFMLQKEVVDRMCAEKNTKSYGRLSVMLQIEFDVIKMFNVPPHAFQPPPKVDSAIVQLIPKNSSWENPQIKIQFETIVRECFSHRRKTLKNIFNMLKYDVSQMADFCENIDFSSRPENLSGEDYKKLAEAILTRGK
jgi:16S rRNA (adenine1518-N6/adenine1519-N6)-dimethyltransferase